MTTRELLILCAGVNIGALFMLAVHLGCQILDDRRDRKQRAATAGKAI